MDIAGIVRAMIGSWLPTLPPLRPAAQTLATMAWQRRRSLAILAAAIAVGVVAAIWSDVRVPGRIIVSQPDVYTRERLVNDRLRHEYWLSQQLEATDTLAGNGRFDAPQARTSRRSAAATVAGVTVGTVEGNAAAVPVLVAGSEEPEPSRGASDLRISPVDRFRDMAAYRDEIRQELMQTQLDDRHDIAGNTLVRLDFDITTLPLSSARNRAMVVVKVEATDDERRAHAHDSQSEKEPNRSNEEENRIYQQWMGYLTSVYNAKATGLLRLVVKRTGDANDPSIYENLSKLREFLVVDVLDKIIENRFERKNIGVRGEDCASDIRSRSRDVEIICRTAKTSLEMLVKYMHSIREALAFTEFARTASITAMLWRQKNEDAAQNPRMRRSLPVSPSDSQRAALYSVDGLGLLVPVLSKEYGLKQYMPLSKHSSSISKLNYLNIMWNKYINLRSVCNYQAMNSKTGNAGVVEIDLMMSDLQRQTKQNIECPSPPRNTLYDEIEVLVALHEILNNQRLLELKLPISDTESAPDLLEKLEAGYRPGVVGETDDLILESLADPNRSRRLQVGEVAPELVANVITEFISYQIEHDVLGDGHEKIGDYYSVVTTGCQIGKCRIRLKEKCIDSKSENSSITTIDKAVERSTACEYKDAQQKLIDTLKSRGKNRVFVYNIVPKQLTEKLAGQESDSRTLHLSELTAMRALGATDAGTLFQHMNALHESVEALENNALVVGFSAGGRDDTGACTHDLGNDQAKSEACAVFGWILSPPLTSVRSDVGYLPVERTVSATLSLPSWWQSARISVATCWVADGWWQRRSGQFWSGGDVADCFEGTSKPEVYKISLPGTVIEIARTLGLEVRQEPYIAENPGAVPDRRQVEIGRPAMLVVQGGRLWRGTAVTLAGYLKADRIEVTPDMKGLIAHFKCITPPPVPDAPPLIDVRDVNAQAPQSPPPGPADRSATEGESPLLGGGPSQQKPLQELTIWTSEGRVATSMIQFTPFKTFAIVDADGRRRMAEKPCWLNDETAAPGTVAPGDAFAAAPSTPPPAPVWPPPGPGWAGLTPTTVPRRRGLLRLPRRRRACGRSLRGGPGRAAA